MSYLMTQTIKLDFPIADKEELTMRRPKVADKLAAERSSGKSSGGAFEVALFARLIGVNPADMEEMDDVDYDKCQDAYVRFLSRKSKTSETEPSSSAE